MLTGPPPKFHGTRDILYGHLVHLLKEPAMLPSARPARRAVISAIGTGLIGGALLFGAAATDVPATT